MATTSATTSTRAGVPVLRDYRGPQGHALMVPVANAVRAHNDDPEIGTVADMDNYYSRFDQARLLREPFEQLLQGAFDQEVAQRDESLGIDVGPAIAPGRSVRSISVK